MSDLQIGLAILGVLIVVAVLAFNYWQERQFQRRGEQSFTVPHDDVLLDRASAAEATSPGPVEETGGYRMFQQDGQSVGGLMGQMQEGQPTAWSTYVSVADADETAAKVTAAGGTVVVAPMDVMDIGRMAVFADPTGAVFGVWQPKSFTGADLVNEPNSLCWNEVLTRDADADKRFYPAVFGWGAGRPSFEGAPDMWSIIRARDVLVHHPYHAFDTVTRFVREAAVDPKVLAIKMTLYRVSPASPIAHALHTAVENGKEVAVLVELQARFDEEANIRWARALEEVGAHVVYGMVGFKTHCKACLIVRQDSDGIRRYCHLATGNYNVRTGGIYSDLGLFTSRDSFGEDLTALFDVLTGSNMTPTTTCGYLCQAGPGYDGPTGLGTPNGISGF